jgi:L-lactate dehydrogenase complex protein LldE
MKVQLMLTCLCDAFYGEVGIAAVRVLEAAGCTVVFLDQQTCCGQPPFNSGDWDAARAIGDRIRQVFDPSMPIVAPSASCTAMVRDGFHLLWPDRDVPECFEIAEFLIHRMGIANWPPNSDSKGGANQRIAFHRACHGRGIGLRNEQWTLLKSVPGIELLEFGEPEQCCGFGGAFSATHGKLSQRIGEEKLSDLASLNADCLVSGDMGCLMHLSTLAKKMGKPIEVRHYLEIMAGAIPE